MKKQAIALAASLICLTIVALVIGPVNHRMVIHPSQPDLYRADGAPVPPPIPPGITLVADGAPVPPPIPPGITLVADGAPVPPPIPNFGAHLAV